MDPGDAARVSLASMDIIIDVAAVEKMAVRVRKPAAAEGLDCPYMEPSGPPSKRNNMTNTVLKKKRYDNMGNQSNAFFRKYGPLWLLVPKPIPNLVNQIN